MSFPNPIGSDPLRRAADRIARAQRVFVLTGAGVSAESGISTFRDARTGLWSKFDPMRLASQEGFAEDPGLIWSWYIERLGAVEMAAPNAGHKALAELELIIPDFTLATQNVDNLHERAGGRSVLHLHGSITQFRCNGCGRDYELQPHDRTLAEPPRCPDCGAHIRPGVVWFGELLPAHVLNHCSLAARRCEVMVVVGTSGIVYPAAGLPEVAKAVGATVIDVNPEPNPISDLADIYLEGPGGEVLPQLVEQVKLLRSARSRA